MTPSSGTEVPDLEEGRSTCFQNSWHRVTFQKTSIFTVNVPSVMIRIQTMQSYGKISNLASSNGRLTLVLISSNWYLYKIVARTVKGT